ncbi:MAG: SDR family NAD(P)-dependent oxidoreductase [Candidatus Kariarchaeaceae archaeon]
MSKAKTVLITGATDGIGKELARSLVQKGYNLILHGRNEDKGRKLLSDLKSINADPQINYFNADLSFLSEVNSLADRLIQNFDKIDILVNNAGTIEKNRIVTSEGFEKSFVVNHLSMFLLTLKLLSTLRNETPSRIINVSSQVHSSSLDFDNLQGQKRFSPTGMYSTTKLLNILFTYKLADLVKDSNITVNCLHPGVINTKLLRAFWGGGGPTSSKTLEFMVETPELDHITGKYYNNSSISKSKSITYDKEIQEKVWNKSEEMTNHRFNF